MRVLITGDEGRLGSRVRAQLASARIGEIAIQYRLTNSSFRPAMLVEALKIYIALKR